MSEGGWLVSLVVVGAAIWFFVGDPARDLRRILNQQTYEDRFEALKAHVQTGNIGDGSDVWLVKQSIFGQQDHVVLFFGYMDDWSACTEFAEMYMQRFPANLYSCQLAN